MAALRPTPTRSSLPTASRRTDRVHRLSAAFARGTLALLASISLVLLTVSSAYADVTATPTAPPGADGLQDLLNWTLYGGAIACAITTMVGLAKMGLSHTQQSYQGSNHGKSIALLGLAGALGLGLTPTIVNGLTAVH